MQAADWHIYQVLTKRHERMRELLSGDLVGSRGCRTSGSVSASRIINTDCRE